MHSAIGILTKAPLCHISDFQCHAEPARQTEGATDIYEVTEKCLEFTSTCPNLLRDQMFNEELDH